SSTGRVRANSPRRALLSNPAVRRARRVCNSSSAIKPLRPRIKRPLGVAGAEKASRAPPGQGGGAGRAGGGEHARGVVGGRAAALGGGEGAPPPFCPGAPPLETPAPPR